MRLIEAGRSKVDFRHVIEPYRTVSLDVPEQAIAYDEIWIRRLYEKCGLKVMRLEYDSWCSRRNYLSYQDIIFGVKG